VKHETNGTFYMDVKETNEIWTKGRLIRRKADDPKGSCFFSVNDQVKIDNSLCAFILVERKSMKYICRYKLNGTLQVTESDDLCKLTQGFWVDKFGNFTHGGDAEKFIMPHMISEIKKGKKGKHEVVDAEFPEKETS
jgi:hypothetical protein